MRNASNSLYYLLSETLASILQLLNVEILHKVPRHERVASTTEVRLHELEIVHHLRHMWARLRIFRPAFLDERPRIIRNLASLFKSRRPRGAMSLVDSQNDHVLVELVEWPSVCPHLDTIE
jgi:hypothetical protein